MGASSEMVKNRFMRLACCDVRLPEWPDRHRRGARRTMKKPRDAGLFV
jgi:hypothetical protein